MQLIFSALFSSLIGAIFLRQAARWSEGLELRYGDAFVTMMSAASLGVLLKIVVGVGVMIVMPNDPAGLMWATSLIVISMFFTYSAIISSRHNLSFVKGMKVMGLLYLLAITVAAVYAAIVLSLQSPMEQ